MSFLERHLGCDTPTYLEMLKSVGYSSFTDLTRAAVPATIRMKNSLDLPAPLTEESVLKKARLLAEKNKLFKSFIGLGYYGTHTPSVIQRKVFENPSWYTAYTPYQAEIAQGRLEALLNFQTMVMELTGLQIANASLLDEATAAAEAMALCYHLQKGTKHSTFLVDVQCFPQTIDVLKTRAEPLGLKVKVADPNSFDYSSGVFGVLLQYPNRLGQVLDYTSVIEKAHAQKAMAVVAADLLSLALLKTPGEMGADIAVGTTQRFGVPMGFGGPHAAYFATKDEYKRLIPGRLVGVSVDSHGKHALRLALQTREQHIRREKATSNICTAQVLLAVMASMYAVYHGPEGLKNIALETHGKAFKLKKALEKLGYKFLEGAFFDTITVKVSGDEVKRIQTEALKAQQNYYYHAQGLSLSVDETTSDEDLETVLKVFAVGKPHSAPLETSNNGSALPPELLRKSSYLDHPVFKTHHSETEMMRYIHRLESRDLSLVHSMIPLGSCTMKLNAATEMLPLTWPKFAGMHPFVPVDQAQGTLQMIHELEKQLAEITGFSGVSLQPNAGSQGEYAGLLTIRRYHLSRGDTHRDVCLIPSSAHGTNPASAVMAGMKVVVVQSTQDGNIDVTDLRKKAEQYKDDLAALMVTYPSTHGVFEETIREICDVIHANGGQVYMDGANLNALVGLCQPGGFGADVSHLNLHKTFCIPHGGGGPGVGPIGVAKHLVPFLPSHIYMNQSAGTYEVSEATHTHAVSAAPWGSALILWIPWSYISMMGGEGLKTATEVAILNANYMAERLKKHYPVLYSGHGGLVAHECILDVRQFKATTGVGVEDIAKRLMDYGFHAPTMSWPVAGTLMIEPTESESRAEIDRFCDAMIAIREEITQIEKAVWTQEDNPLKGAPHTLDDLTRGPWTRGYSTQVAVLPREWLKDRKFFVAVNRIDNAYGDKNLVCSCAPIEDYQ